MVICLSRSAISEETSLEQPLALDVVFKVSMIKYIGEIVTTNTESAEAIGVDVMEIKEEVARIIEPKTDEEIGVNITERFFSLLITIINQINSQTFVEVLSTEPYRKQFCEYLEASASDLKEGDEALVVSRLYEIKTKGIAACNSGSISPDEYKSVLQKIVEYLKNTLLPDLESNLKSNTSKDDDKYDFLYGLLLGLL